MHICMFLRPLDNAALDNSIINIIIMIMMIIIIIDIHVVIIIIIVVIIINIIIVAPSKGLPPGGKDVEDLLEDMCVCM